MELKFVTRSKQDVVDQIIDDKRSLLNIYINDHLESLDEKLIKRFNDFQDRIDDDDEVHHRLEIDIIAMLIDLKDVIKEDLKKHK